MFDIGFSEIVVCAIVALLVIGPERMPEAVRTVGLWIGRLKRSLRETRSEIERQIGVDDIRRQLHNEDIMRSIEDARKNMDNIIAQTQDSLNAIEHDYKSEPDLPYHAHTEEHALAAQTAELPAPDAALELPTIAIPEQPSATANKQTPTDTKAAAESKVELKVESKIAAAASAQSADAAPLDTATPLDKPVPLDKKVSL